MTEVWTMFGRNGPDARQILTAIIAIPVIVTVVYVLAHALGA